MFVVQHFFYLSWAIKHKNTVQSDIDDFTMEVIPHKPLFRVSFFHWKTKNLCKKFHRLLTKFPIFEKFSATTLNSTLFFL